MKEVKGSLFCLTKDECHKHDVIISWHSPHRLSLKLATCYRHIWFRKFSYGVKQKQQTRQTLTFPAKPLGSWIFLSFVCCTGDFIMNISVSFLFLVSNSKFFRKLVLYFISELRYLMSGVDQRHTGFLLKLIICTMSLLLLNIFVFYFSIPISLAFVYLFSRRSKRCFLTRLTFIECSITSSLLFDFSHKWPGYVSTSCL